MIDYCNIPLRFVDHAKWPMAITFKYCCNSSGALMVIYLQMFRTSFMVIGFCVWYYSSWFPYQLFNSSRQSYTTCGSQLIKHHWVGWKLFTNLRNISCVVFMMFTWCTRCTTLVYFEVPLCHLSFACLKYCLNKWWGQMIAHIAGSRSLVCPLWSFWSYGASPTLTSVSIRFVAGKSKLLHDQRTGQRGCVPGIHDYKFVISVWWCRWQSIFCTAIKVWDTSVSPVCSRRGTSSDALILGRGLWHDPQGEKANASRSFSHHLSPRWSHKPSGANMTEKSARRFEYGSCHFLNNTHTYYRAIWMYTNIKANECIREMRHETKPTLFSCAYAG